MWCSFISVAITSSTVAATPVRAAQASVRATIRQESSGSCLPRSMRRRERSLQAVRLRLLESPSKSGNRAKSNINEALSPMVNFGQRLRVRKGSGRSRALCYRPSESTVGWVVWWLHRYGPVQNASVGQIATARSRIRAAIPARVASERKGEGYSPNESFAHGVF